MTIRNRTRGTVLATDERWARTPAERMRGLLDADDLPPGGCLVISPCNSVHMFGMKFPLDVVFCKADGTVVRAISCLRPWRLTRIYFTAKHTLELPVGVVAQSGTAPGDALEWDEPPAIR